MDQETKRALRGFFSAQVKLTQLGVIHSRDYIGDIATRQCTSRSNGSETVPR